jgi:hypothetical protein
MTVEINPDKVPHELQDKYMETQTSNTASILGKMKETYLFTDQFKNMKEFLDIKRIDYKLNIQYVIIRKLLGRADQLIDDLENLGMKDVSDFGSRVRKNLVKCFEDFILEYKKRNLSERMILNYLMENQPIGAIYAYNAAEDPKGEFRHIEEASFLCDVDVKKYISDKSSFARLRDVNLFAADQ